MPVIKRRTVKKPKYTPEEMEAQRLERIRVQNENMRLQNEREALRRQEAAEKLARYEAELAADNRPRWMRDSVVDPDWIAAYEKSNPPVKRPFRLGNTMLECVGYAGEAASAVIFGKQFDLTTLARLCTDEDARADASDEREGRHEVATAVARIIAITLDAADDTIPEDGKPGQLPDRAKVDAELRTTLVPALNKLHIAVNTVIGRITANDDKHDPIGDQLQADLWYRAIDEVDYDWAKNGIESL